MKSIRRINIMSFSLAVYLFLSCPVFADSSRNPVGVNIALDDEHALAIEKEQPSDATVTITVFDDKRTAGDKSVIGTLKKKNGTQIPIVAKNLKTAESVTSIVKEYFKRKGYSVTGEMTVWNQKEETINSKWGKILIGGSIDRMEVSYEDINPDYGVASFRTDVKMTFVLADAQQGKILDRMEGSSFTSAQTMTLVKTEADKNRNEEDTVRQRIEEQISATILKAIKKAFAGRGLAGAKAAAAPKADIAVSKPFVKTLKSKRPTFTDPMTGMEFILVKGGCFNMGETVVKRHILDKPVVHEVCVDDFYMGKYEVTQGQWKKIMKNNRSYFKDCGDDCPMESISWNYAQEFIRTLNSLGNTDMYRLPTEAEWEYAARAGTTTRFHWGDNNDCAKANYGMGWSKECKGINPGKPMKVGSFPPNAWGLYDMHGNVWEWVQDRYGADYYAKSPKNNPGGPSEGLDRVRRGGSWEQEAERCSAAIRWHSGPGDKNYDIGFRLVKTE